MTLTFVLAFLAPLGPFGSSSLLLHFRSRLIQESSPHRVADEDVPARHASRLYLVFLFVVPASSSSALTCHGPLRSTWMFETFAFSRQAAVFVTMRGP